MSEHLVCFCKAGGVWSARVSPRVSAWTQPLLTMVPWPNVAVTDVSDRSVAANGSVSMWSPSLPSLPTALRLVKGISTQRGSPTAPFVFTMCLCFTAVWTVSASQ